jgi:opacity protein-like surface antigen
MSHRKFPFAATLVAAAISPAIASHVARAAGISENIAVAPSLGAPAPTAPATKLGDIAFDDVLLASHDACCDAPLSQAIGCRNCDRWYLGVSGGWQQRETVHEASDPQTFIVFDGGFLINAQLGYRFDRFRIEAETSFMNNEVDRAGAAGFDTPSAGNVNLRAYMLNIYRDFQISDWLWEPYLGAGIGIYQSEINGLYPDFFAFAGPSFDGSPVNATSDMPLAYQFRFGVCRPVGRRSEFLLGYRYFRGEELQFASAPFASAAAPTFHPKGADIHSVECGLRIRF